MGGEISSKGDGIMDQEELDNLYELSRPTLYVYAKLLSKDDRVAENIMYETYKEVATKKTVLKTMQHSILSAGRSFIKLLIES